MARMTTTTNSNLLRSEFFAKRFVEAAREKIVLMGLGLKEDAPRSNGKVAVWQYFSNPSAVTTALSEGGDPTSSTDLSTTTASATMAEYGAYFEPAKVFLGSAASGTKDEIVKAAGYQAGISLDTIIQTTSLQATTVTGGSGAMTIDKIRVAASALGAASEQKHPATAGGRHWALVIDSNMFYDMAGETTDFSGTQTPTFWMVEKTSSGMRDGAGQAGTANVMYDSQVFRTENLQTEGSNTNVYNLGKNSFGVVSLDSNMMDPRVIITDPEQRVDVYLRNRGSVGWWVFWATTLIRSNATYEILSTG